jgi:hypothetical protein
MRRHVGVGTQNPIQISPFLAHFPLIPFSRLQLLFPTHPMLAPSATFAAAMPQLENLCKKRQMSKPVKMEDVALRKTLMASGDGGGDDGGGGP